VRLIIALRRFNHFTPGASRVLAKYLKRYLKQELPFPSRSRESRFPRDDLGTSKSTWLRADAIAQICRDVPDEDGGGGEHFISSLATGVRGEI